MYSFLFDRRSLFLVLAGLATAGCLLFVSGLLVGVSSGLPFAAPAPAPPRAAATAAASRPCPPALAPPLRAESEDEVAFEDDGEPVPLFAAEDPAPREAEPAAPRPAEAVQRPAAPRSLPPAEEPAEAPWAKSLPYADFRPEAPAQSSAPPSALRPPASEPATPALALASLGNSGAARSEAPLSPPSAGRYSLQVGAYRQAENSAKAVEELQILGYDAYVVEEGRGGSLHSVRIGRYADRSEAHRAAQEFRQRQGREAIIRSKGL